MRRRLAGLASALCVVALVAGCTSTSVEDTPRASTPKPTHTSAVVTSVTTPPGTETGFVGARSDVDVTVCTATSAPARFSGTVTNPERSTQSYRIYVSVLQRTSTLAVAEIDVPGVAPGAKKTWSGAIAAGGTDARCVLRVERTAQ